MRFFWPFQNCVYKLGMMARISTRSSHWREGSNLLKGKVNATHKQIKIPALSVVTLQACLLPKVLSGKVVAWLWIQGKNKTGNMHLGSALSFVSGTKTKPKSSGK